MTQTQKCLASHLSSTISMPCCSRAKEGPIGSFPHPAKGVHIMGMQMSMLIFYIAITFLHNCKLSFGFGCIRKHLISTDVCNSSAIRVIATPQLKEQVYNWQRCWKRLRAKRGCKVIALNANPSSNIFPSYAEKY